MQNELDASDHVIINTQHVLNVALRLPQLDYNLFNIHPYSNCNNNIPLQLGTLDERSALGRV